MFYSNVINRNLHAMITPQVEKWFIQQCQDCNTRFYVYLKKSAPQAWGDVVIAKSVPSDDYTILIQERLSIGKTKEQVHYQIFHALRNAPILPICNKVLQEGIRL